MSSSLTVTDPYADRKRVERELFERNRQLSEAEQTIARLEGELRSEHLKVTQIERGVSELRKILSPLYGALRMVFGEIDIMAPDSPVPQSDPRKHAIWESWKAKLPAGEGRALDALLLHGTMNTGQLRIHIGCASRTAQNIVVALKSKGLIVKNKGQISLKEL